MSKSSNIKRLPVWKKGSTAAEKLSELANLANEHPEYFGVFVICYENKEDQSYQYITHGNARYSEIIGLLEIFKLDIQQERIKDE